MRLELTHTGFAIRRLSRLATRAKAGRKDEGGRMKLVVFFHPSYLILILSFWNGRRDSNSRIEFGRLACFQLHHFRSRTFDCEFRIADLPCVSLALEIADSCCAKFLNPQSATRNPKFEVELLARLELATSTFEASRSVDLSYRSQRHCRLSIACCRFDSMQRANWQSRIGNLVMFLIGMDRVELSPRVPRTRMLALHHTPY